MIKFTRFTTFLIFSHQSGSEWPILPDSQLFQSFSTEVAQNDLEQPILPNPQLFQSFFAEVAQNDSQWPISPDSQFFQSFPTEVPQNDLEWPILPDSQLFQSFPTKVAQNDLEWPILNGQNKIHSDTREFLWKITLLHGQLCPKPYGFLVNFSWNFGSTWHFGSGWWPLHFWKSWILSKLQLFQSFPTRVAQNDLEWPISPDSQLFQSFPTKVAQNDSEWPILHGQNKIHSDTREFLWKITLLHGQLCPKPYGFLVNFSWNFGSTWHFGSGWWPLHFWKSWILSKLQLFQSFPTEVAHNDSKWPISPNSQLFQSFPTKVAQNNSERPISPDSQLLQSFSTEVAQNGQFCLIHNFSNLFLPKWLRMTGNGQFSMAKIKYTLIQGNFYERSPFYMDSCALSPMASLLTSAGILGQHDILVLADDPSTSGKVGFYPSCNFSNLFPPEWLRMTWNGQCHLIHNFSNLFPPKWLRMTRNGQFSMAKIKYTLIQGNFYERSPFYMDSCALSPMASLLTSAGILGQHDNFARFATFPIFSHQSGSEWLGTANFAWFATFPIFSHWSGS